MSRAFGIVSTMATGLGAEFCASAGCATVASKAAAHTTRSISRWPLTIKSVDEPIGSGIGQGKASLYPSPHANHCSLDISAMYHEPDLTPATEQADPRPKSAVSGGVGFAGLAGMTAWI